MQTAKTLDEWVLWDAPFTIPDTTYPSEEALLDAIKQRREYLMQLRPPFPNERITIRHIEEYEVQAGGE